jgi:hypothetical protein
MRARFDLFVEAGVLFLYAFYFMILHEPRRCLRLNASPATPLPHAEMGKAQATPVFAGARGDSCEIESSLNFENLGREKFDGC